MKKIGRRVRKFLFPPADAPRWMRFSPFLVSGVIFILILTGATYAWEYSNSPEFCGTGCHTMPPEYMAYQASPHAEVKCVECHIGREFVGNQLTRKIGDFRHVVAMTTKNFEYPIEIKSMRPASETCERCHNPDKFSDDSRRAIFHFDPDENNTPYVTYLTMKTGGGTVRQGLGKGIHWHIQNQVLYYAEDSEEQVIPFVKVVNLDDGTTTEYVDINSDFDPYQIDDDQLKQMDCITCHNRISHSIPHPEEAVDQALARGLISTQIPEIRLKAVEVLEDSYDSKEKALLGIARLDEYYQDNHPDFYENHYEELFEVINCLKEIYTKSVFHEQKVDWNTHPNNLGHVDDSGCFRCHDGNHFDIAGRAIRVECNLCHSIPVTKGPYDQITTITIDHRRQLQSHASTNWIALHRYVFDDNDEHEVCSSCHDTANYEAADDSSFCANSACHGSIGESVDLGGFEDYSTFEVVVQQLPHYPDSLPPLEAWADEPQSLDSIHRDQEEMECEECHDPFPPDGLPAPPPNEICISCHGETEQGVLDLTAKYEPNPHDSHAGDVSCAYCHPNFGPEKSPCSLCHEDEPLTLIEAREK